jgi:hypothetical protein
MMSIHILLVIGHLVIAPLDMLSILNNPLELSIYANLLPRQMGKVVALDLNIDGTGTQAQEESLSIQSVFRPVDSVKSQLVVCLLVDSCHLCGFKHAVSITEIGGRKRIGTPPQYIYYLSRCILTCGEEWVLPDHSRPFSHFYIFAVPFFYVPATCAQLHTRSGVERAA